MGTILIKNGNLRIFFVPPHSTGIVGIDGVDDGTLERAPEPSFGGLLPPSLVEGANVAPSATTISLAPGECAVFTPATWAPAPGDRS